MAESLDGMVHGKDGWDKALFQLKGRQFFGLVRVFTLSNPEKRDKTN
jgi:hypothetical protein